MRTHQEFRNYYKACKPNEPDRDKEPRPEVARKPIEQELGLGTNRSVQA